MKDLKQSLSQDIYFCIVFHFKVCVKVLVRESRILILGMKGTFFRRGRKITKFDFFMFKDNLKVAKLVINKRFEFL